MELRRSRHPLPLMAGHLEPFAMELYPVSSLVYRGNLPHPSLKDGDVGLCQADHLGDWIGSHREIVLRAGTLAAGILRLAPIRGN